MTRSRTSSLSHPGYRRYFLAQAFSLTGFWMQNTALSWLAYSISGSAAMPGILAAVSSIPVVLLSPLGGRIADRFHRPDVMAATQSLSAVVAFLLAAVLAFDLASLWQLFAASAVNGILTAIEMPSRNALASDMVPQDTITNAVGLNSVQFQMARIAGPVAAGFLIPGIGPWVCFLANGLSFAGVVAVLSTMKDIRPSGTKGHKTAVSKKRQTADIRGECPFLTRRLAELFLVGVFGWSWVVILPAVASETLGVASRGYAFLMTSAAVGAVAGSFIVSQSAGMRRSVINPMFLLAFVAGGLIVATSSSFFMAMLGAAPAGLGIAAFTGRMNASIQEDAPAALRGRVMGLHATVVGAMIPVGSMAAAAVTHFAGPSTALICCCTGCSLIAVWMSAGRMFSRFSA